MALHASREVEAAAPAQFSLDPELRAVLRAIDAATPAEHRVTARTLDQLVRERTAGKGYKPAQQWSLCAGCGLPCSSRERLAISTDGSVRHERCR